jgi:uncharacterized protein (TIGR02246 family)
VDLQELEAIKRLKYRYLRCLDLKLWEEMADCFTEDATSAYGDGKYAFAGRDEILAFLVKALGPHHMVTAHRVHHPEIEIRSDGTASGRWALDDVVIDTRSQFTIRGAAIYDDEYAKGDGRWRIRSTGYRRIYEEVQSRKESPSLRLTANLWGGSPR